MKFVVINYSNPNLKHISALRMKKFSEQLLRFNHSVIYITANEKNRFPYTDLEKSKDILSNIKPGEKKDIYIPNPSNKLESIIDSEKINKFIRKGLIFFSYLFRNGLQISWKENSKPYLNQIQEIYKPDIVWACFGNVDSLILGKKLSSISNSKFIVDIKDPFELIPSYFLKYIFFIIKLRNINAYTTNSNWQYNRSIKWIKKECLILYSGVDQEIISNVLFQDSTKIDMRITIIGSTYNENNLKQLLLIYLDLFKNLYELGYKFELFYCGTSYKEVKRCLLEIGFNYKYKVLEHIELGEMLEICRTSTINSYIHSDECFHHKAIELMLLRRPLFAFPKENNELHDIANKLNTLLLEVGGQNLNANKIIELYFWRSQNNSNVYNNYSWEKVIDEGHEFLIK